jgi:hypothetical protein
LGADLGADLGAESSVDLGTDVAADLGTDVGVDLGTDVRVAPSSTAVVIASPGVAAALPCSLFAPSTALDDRGVDLRGARGRTGVSDDAVEDASESPLDAGTSPGVTVPMVDAAGSTGTAIDALGRTLCRAGSIAAGVGWTVVRVPAAAGWAGWTVAPGIGNRTGRL